MNSRYRGTAGPTVFAMDEWNKQESLRMNPQQRAALIEELAALVANGSDNAYAVLSARAKVKEVLTRAEPEPDGDAVERAAKAMFRVRWQDSTDPWATVGENERDKWSDYARAALQAAAGSDADLQRDIAAWARKTFGAETPQVMRKMVAEYHELDHAIHVKLPREDVAKEAADVLFMLFQLAENFEFNLLEETRKKFAINKARKWQPKPDGTYQHVKEASHE